MNPRTPPSRFRKPNARLWSLALLMAGLGCIYAAESPAPPGLEDFKLISERNIFNPNRSVRQARVERPTRTEPERPPHRESLALLGTLSYPKGQFAVFGGSEPGFRKVIQVSDSVAGCKIMAVAPAQVTLNHNGKEIELQVGMQMERQDEGEWNVTGAAKPQDRAPSLASVTDSGESSGKGNDDDVIRRMLEKRAQELKQ